ncbi:hypothetical protein [Nonomuraea recticatena]|uniref:Uncharacterized protein n=1 Tax=Nonomuraea recticatena TaxID=46178 RepID=A0ABP6FEB4_9ACTN
MLMLSDSETVVDMIGNTYGVGDYVFYARRSGNTGELGYGIVTKVDATWREKMDGGYWSHVVTLRPLAYSDGYVPAGKPTKPNVDRIVLAPTPRDGRRINL